MMSKFHHFPVAGPSIWPLINSLGAFNLLFSLLMFFKYQDIFTFLVSLLFLVLSMFNWWLNYSFEFNLPGVTSDSLESGVKFSMLLFISSEVLFFFSFFWAYMHFYLSPTFQISMEWPPHGILMFDFSNVPMLNTLVLLTSGILVTISHYYLNEGVMKNTKFYLIFTISLGLIFSLLQLMEYNSSFFSIWDSSFGTVFFMLTGFHGLHVLIGTIFLFTVFISMFSLSLSKSNFLSFDLSVWYWHFVDIVWLILFFLVYYCNSFYNKLWQYYLPSNFLML